MLVKSVTLASALLALTALPGCTGSRFGKVTKAQMLTDDGQSESMPNPGAPVYRISSINVEDAPKGTGKIANVFFNVATSAAAPLSKYCEVDGAKGCACQYSWTENNTTNGYTVKIPHKVNVKAIGVQASMIACPVPDAWDKEMIDGTALRVAVVTLPGNESPINVPSKGYTKGPVAKTYTFLDAQGRAFENVLRYSCYDQTQRGLTIKSRITVVANPSQPTQSVRIPAASHFCVADRNGKFIGGGEECEGNASTEFSSQSNYFNLYIREGENGDINSGNEIYTCPKLHDADKLNPSRPYYPLDATFSLSVGPSPDFPVGVEAYSKTSNPGDPKSVNTSCFTTTSGGDGQSTLGQSGDGKSLVKSCLGFASKPISDGSCPSFKDADGKLVHTYRLRRFVAIYPPQFDTNGNFLKEGQASDTIYVIDRPISVPGRDPNKPEYTMFGPKPCPFSYFDRKMVTGTVAVKDGTTPVPTYAATNNTNWNYTNVDGLELPNIDSANSCSAVLPVLSKDKTIFSLATVNMYNPVYRRQFIRPQLSWAPHYEEDTDFQACAPMARPFRDPPLHFAKMGENVSWCAEVYPSQNSRVAALEQSGGTAVKGKVIPFTSHIVKNSKSSSCSARSLASVPNSIPSGYPGDGAALHPSSIPVDGGAGNASQTCDRTVVLDGNSFERFPLLAGALHTERALASDPSYSCLVSWDEDGAKLGSRSPKGGCCGPATQVVSGTGGASNAHLEPDAKCETPEY